MNVRSILQVFVHSAGQRYAPRAKVREEGGSKCHSTRGNGLGP